MTAFRVTQVFAGLIGDFSPEIRASTSLIEVMYDADPAIRFSTTLAEVLYDAGPDLRFSLQHVDIIYDANPALRVTQYHLEVLYAAVPPPEPDEFLFRTWPTPTMKWSPVSYGEKWGPQAS